MLVCAVGKAMGGLQEGGYSWVLELGGSVPQYGHLGCKEYMRIVP